jgi:hypothetical protein
VRLGGLGLLKNAVTSGIEPATFMIEYNSFDAIGFAVPSIVGQQRKRQV